MSRFADRLYVPALLGLVLLLPSAAAAQDPPPPPPAPDEEREPFEGGSVRFVTLDPSVADLRAFDPTAAAAALPPIDASAGQTAEGAIEAARTLFDAHGFDEVEQMVKAGAIDPATSDIVAEGRRRMIGEAMKAVVAQYEAEGVKLKVGSLDSGNKNSGIASDIDQTLFVLSPDGRPIDVNPNDVAERFNAEFERLYGFTPERMAIESMNGNDFYPDWRAGHMTLSQFREEARRVVLEKRRNPEAYRSEGELAIQAAGRGYEALRDYFETLERLDDRLAEARRTASSDPTADPEADPTVRRLRAEIQEMQRLGPWTQFEMTTDAEGNRVPAEVRDVDPRDQVMQNEPERVRRFAFDGSYDNWLMFQAHPGNRPKYLLRSVADGIGLTTSVRVDDGGRYDLDRPWAAQPVEYEKLYADPSADADAARRQFLVDVYGGLQGSEGGLTLQKIETALAVASKARLRHKGTGGFATLTEAQIYREYMPQGERFADWDEPRRLDWAKRAWEVDAREIMLENLLRTVRAPGDITQGWADPSEWAAIRERFPIADHPHITPTRLKAAAWLQLYHGFLDLMTPEHARQILDGMAEGRRPLTGITGQPEGRVPDLVDRLVLELQRIEGPEAEEARAELEKVLIDAAITRQKLDPDLAQPRLRTAVEQVIRQEARTRIMAAQTAIEEMRQNYEAVRTRLVNGEYTREVVADRVIEGTADQLARATQSVLGSLGFEGEVQVRRTITYLGEVEQRGVPEIEVRLADRPWNARTALSNFANAGNVDSFTQIILAYQTGGAEEAARVAVRELAMNLPGVSQSTTLWDGAITGNWQGAWMMGTGMLIPVAGQGYVLVSIATNSVQILGNAVLEPLFDDDRDMAYQGFLGGENGFVEDQRGQRVSVLHTVPITVIPITETAPDGTSATRYATMPYDRGEARRVLETHGGDVGVELEGIPVDTVVSFGEAEGLWGGGEDWDAWKPQAEDWINQPRLHFEAKRASLWHHYRNDVDAWLADQGLDTEVLVATEIRSAAVERLAPFFMRRVGDWAFGRGDFEGVVGGENELMLPVDAQQRTAFFQRIAQRMAGDYVRSFRIAAFNPVENADGSLIDTSLEAGMARTVAGAVKDRLSEEATMLAVAIEESRGPNEVAPALAEAVNGIRMERVSETLPAPRIHVRPRVFADESAGSGGEAGAPGPSDQIEFLVSVVADTVRHPGPYHHTTEWLTTETDDPTRIDLAARVSVLDRNRALVGQPVDVALGTIVGDAPPTPIVALEPMLEARRIAAEPEARAGAGSPDASGESPTRRVEARGGALANLLIYDDIEVFFQPARDTAQQIVEWRIARIGETDTATVARGVALPNRTGLDDTERAGPDAPAPYRAVIPHSRMWREQRGAGAGTYVLQTCVPDELAIFGLPQTYVGCFGPWIDEAGGEQPARPSQDEGSFVVGDARLVLKDFIAERGTLGTPDGDGPWMTLEGARLDGSRGTVDAAYTVADRSSTHRARVSLDLPGEFDLQAPASGEAQLALATVSGAPPSNAVAELFPMHPTVSPTRDMSSAGGSDATVTLHPPSADDAFGRYSTEARAPLGGTSEVVHLHNGFSNEAGSPDERPLGEWLRDPAAHWFIPVSIRAGNRTLYAFAVYGASPGPYTGPIPTAPGATTIAADDDAADDAAGDGMPPGVDPGDGADPPPPTDSGALNPDDPDIGALIDEWLGVARPPAAVEPDNFYTYDEWGRMVGNGYDGNVVTNGTPETGGLSREGYVWNQRGTLDSVDHCTVGEYVQRRLEGASIADCEGRYRPMPRAEDFTGRPLAPVRSGLEGEGYPVEVSIAEWPTSADQANTVATQVPAPGARMPAGSTVRLGIYGPYTEPDPVTRRVVSVYGLTFEDARGILADSGFAVPAPAGGDPAPTEDMAFRVATQSVAGGEARAPGTEIRLTLFGPFDANAGRGDPGGGAGSGTGGTGAASRGPPANPSSGGRDALSGSGPSCNELVRAANRAQGYADLQGAYELYASALRQGCTNPGLAEAAGSVYQSPRCTSLIESARAAYDRGSFQQAIRSLRDAEREDCDMSGLGPLVDGTLTALETGVAQQMGQSCTGVASEIASARRRGDEGLAQALSTTALVQGCNSSEIGTAMTTPMPPPPPAADPAPGSAGASGGTPAPVDVADAETMNFVGVFQLSDPNRSSAEYNGRAEFRADGTFILQEWVNGEPLRGNGGARTWSWNQSTQTFGFAVVGGGSFRGPVSGNTNDFTINGTWNSGQAGRIRLRR